MPLSPNINWNRWFGFYDPHKAVAPVSPAQIGLFLAESARPISSSEDVRRFFGLASQTIPVLQRVWEPIASGSVQIEVSEIAEALVGLGTNRKILVAPRGIPPAARWQSYLLVSGGLATLPEGVDLPPPVGGNDLDRLVQAMRKSYLWGMALGLSLFYQVTFEMDRLGINPKDFSPSHQVARSMDLALFRIFRDEGLQGLVHAYTRFMTPEKMRVHTESQRRIADRIVADGRTTGDSDEWSPPPLGEKPALPRTLLDDEAEKLTRFGRGLFTRESDLGAIGASRQRELAGLMRKPVQRLKDLAIIPALIRELAPKLAEKILPPLERAEVRIELTKINQGLPVIMEDTGEPLLGLEYRKPPILRVLEGVSLEQALKGIVLHLSKVSIPREYLEEIPWPRGPADTDRIARVLERNYARLDMWAYLASFEFVHEAEGRGFHGFVLKLDERHHEMMRILDECGFAVLCERWPSLISDGIVTTMQRQFLAFAQRIVTQRSGPSA